MHSSQFSGDPETTKKIFVYFYLFERQNVHLRTAIQKFSPNRSNRERNQILFSPTHSIMKNLVARINELNFYGKPTKRMWRRGYFTISKWLNILLLQFIQTSAHVFRKATSNVVSPVNCLCFSVSSNMYESCHGWLFRYSNIIGN